jgi:preprotein translocase subunit SecE
MAKSATAQMVDNGSIGGKLKSWPLRVKSFYNDVRTEMKHVTAPSFKEVKATTSVVLITVGVFAVYFWVIDSILSFSLDRLFRYLTHR